MAANLAQKPKRNWRAALGWMSFLLLLGVVSVAGECWHSGDRLAWWWLPIPFFAWVGLTCLFTLAMAILADDLRTASLGRKCDLTLLIIPVALAIYIALGAVAFFVPRVLTSGDRWSWYLGICVLSAALFCCQLIANRAEARAAQAQN